jgi:sigma-B regulation protein RsbU (phosphoserine phosphatase)
MIYTNAGHTAPVLVGSGIGLLPIDQNTPVGQQANSTFTSQSTLIDPGTVIFLYTNGVTEAENNEHDTFGKDRMMGEALQVLHGKDSSPKAIIDSMNASILRFTDGAEQNDDMAMMAIRYTPKSNGATYQRSISLSNDVENEVPRLTRFTENVCEALHLNDKISAGIKLALEEAVVNVMNYAYSKDTKGDVHIEACADQSTLRFVIRDHGQPFDPTSVPEADTSQPAEERPIGGLGVHIIRQYMDTVHYERTDGENVFTIAKQFKKA